MPILRRFHNVYNPIWPNVWRQRARDVALGALRTPARALRCTPELDPLSRATSSPDSAFLSTFVLPQPVLIYASGKLLSQYKGDNKKARSHHAKTELQ